MLEKIIFTIDNNDDINTVARFLQHISTARASGALKGSFTSCLECCYGDLEVSYMMDRRDYDRLVAPLQFVNNHNYMLSVPADTRQPCTLEFVDGESIPMGRLIEISYEESRKLEMWTYVPATGKYFTTTG